MSFPSQQTKLVADHRGIPNISGIEHFSRGPTPEGPLIAQLPRISPPSAGAHIDPSLVLDVSMSCIQTISAPAITPDKRGRGGIVRVGGVIRVAGLQLVYVYDPEDPSITARLYDPFSSDVIADNVTDRAARLSEAVRGGAILESLPGVSDFLDNRNGDTYLAFYVDTSDTQKQPLARLHYRNDREPAVFVGMLGRLVAEGSREEFFDHVHALADSSDL